MTPSEIKPGMRFGHWTVIRYDHTNKHRIKYFLCRCDCGTVKPVRGTALIKGTSTACSRKCCETIFPGQRFGKWTVLRADKSRPRYYWCRCDCGTERSVYAHSLLAGTSKSCGCMRNNQPFIRRKSGTLEKYRDCVGKKFGKLLVTGFDEKSLTFSCTCDCGNHITVRCHNIVSGDATSCGCQRQETLRKNLKKKYEANVGKKINMLTVDKCYYKNNTFWYDCTCECGKKCTVQATKVVSNYIQSCGCVKSKAEEEMQKILEKHGIRFKREYKFEDCRDKQPLPFDFAIFNDADELVGLIELNGQQHYTEGGWSTKEHLLYTQKHDRIKHRYCEKCKIPFLVIPYQYYDELEKFLMTSDFWEMITKNFND